MGLLFQTGLSCWDEAGNQAESVWSTFTDGVSESDPGTINIIVMLFFLGRTT